MFSKHLAVLLLFSIFIVPASSSGGPVGGKGKVDGSWCYGYSYSECWQGGDERIIIGVNFRGTWPFEGRTVRVQAGFTTVGGRIGEKTYGLQPFWNHIYDARTQERLLIGYCTGTAVVRIVVTIDAECSYTTPDWQDTGIIGPIHVRAAGERAVWDPYYAAYDLVLGPVLGSPCNPMPCPATFEGVYY